VLRSAARRLGVRHPLNTGRGSFGAAAAGTHARGRGREVSRTRPAAAAGG
jgi:hypothetical protein